MTNCKVCLKTLSHQVNIRVSSGTQFKCSCGFSLFVNEETGITVYEKYNLPLNNIEYYLFVYSESYWIVSEDTDPDFNFNFYKTIKINNIKEAYNILIAALLLV